MKKASKQLIKQWWFWLIIVLIALIFPYLLIIGLFVWLVSKSKWSSDVKNFGYISLAIISLCLLIINPSFKSKHDIQSNRPQPTQEDTTTKKKEEKIEYVFDTPGLLGKNIDEIRSILGEPIDGELKEPTQEQRNLGTTYGFYQWYNTFIKSDQELLVTYDVDSREVIDLFISTDNSSGQTKDKQKLLQIGNLDEHSESYRVEFVKVMKDPEYYTGVKIINNQ